MRSLEPNVGDLNSRCVSISSGLNTGTLL